MTALGIRKTLQASYDEVLARVPEALASEGFGVLTEIDVRSTLAQKLGVDFRRYKILGACNPPFAHEALLADLQAGLMMPCNVVVYEDGEDRTVVVAVDPTRTIAALDDPRLTELATAVKDRLTRALEKLG